MRDEATLDGTLDDLKADVSRNVIENDESKITEKSTLSLNQSNLGKKKKSYSKKLVQKKSSVLGKVCFNVHQMSF